MLGVIAGTCTGIDEEPIGVDDVADCGVVACCA
jgi:hypothetical protein